jgi:uncharacterized membrane protein YjjP (DUF1212 family)
LAWAFIELVIKVILIALIGSDDEITFVQIIISPIVYVIPGVLFILIALGIDWINTYISHLKQVR